MNLMSLKILMTQKWNAIYAKIDKIYMEINLNFALAGKGFVKYAV
jgi:hypothetical protein